MTLLQDLRYAARLLRRQPRYALVATLTMALGIGATTILFSVAHGVLMKRLPWAHAERLVVLNETRGGRPPRFNAFSNAVYLAWRDQPSTIDDLAAWSTRTATLSEAGEPDRVRLTVATASLFSTLGVRPIVGSLFEEKDESSKDGSVIVLSESLWRQRFAADPRALGRSVKIDGVPHTIVGVIADAQGYPDPSTRAWVPFRVVPAANNFLSMFNAVARLRDAATVEQAAAEGTARGRNAPDTGMTTMAVFGGSGAIEISATPLSAAMTADVRSPLLVLLAAVGLLLVTATTNVASLQLARATTRRRELAIRAALGAGTARVTRQLLVESVLLGLMGGAAGLILAWLLEGLVPVLLPADFPRVSAIALDSTVLLFTLTASVLSGVLFGVAPALRARRVNLIESLTEDANAPVGAGSRTSVARARAIVMAGQIAIACVLLIGASLLGRSFLALLSADRGYEPAGILTARVSLPASLYTPERRHAIVDQILTRASGMPAVVDAAFTSELPITSGGSTSAFTMPSRVAGGAAVSVQASPRIVSPRSFAALGMRLSEGRDFTDADTDTSQPVVIVNRAFARQYLGEPAIGARVPMGVGYRPDVVPGTVIGVVDDVRYLSSARITQAEIFFSHRQFNRRLVVPVVTFLARTTGDPTALAAALRTAVREADPNLVPDAIVTMESRLMTSLARPRLFAVLLAGFATFALLIAAVGLFGVLSYSVAQRSRELAVRAALGARQRDIVRLVLRQALVITGAGLTAGVVASLILTSTIATQLFGVTPYDARTFIGVPIVLAVVAIAACLGPARRAARLDPLTAMRS
jgi:putative ABC transport system permease protein